MPIDTRPTVAAPDDDPYLWLEEIDGARATAWVDEQNNRTLAQFGTAAFATDRDTLTAIFDRPDNVPFVMRRGAQLYNFWKDAKNPRGLWRRTTLDSFRTTEPHWEIILDVDAIAAQESEDWVWQGASTLPGTHDRAILALSRGGSDAVVLREFDIPAKAFVNGGFYLPEAKGGTAWLDRDTLLLSSAYGKGMATKSGYPRTVRLWRRGSEVDQAPVLLETTQESMGLWAGVDRTQTAETVWFADKPGFFDVVIWLGNRDGPNVKLDLPTDVAVQTHSDWLVVKRRTAWTIGDSTYAPDTLLGTSRPAFLAGERDFTVLFEPGERRALQHFSWSNGQLIVSILDELKSVFEVLTPSCRGWTRSHVSGLPGIGVVHLWPFDIETSEANGDLLASTQDPLTPATMMLIEPGKAPALLKQAPRTFTSDGPRRHSARGSVERWRTHSVCPGWPS
jgi:prolyl oligopeptidase